MYSCLRQIKGFAKSASKKYESLAEMLVLYYAVYHPVDSEKIRERLETIEETIKTLSRRKKRVLSNTVRELCAEYEKAGFLTGVKVGAQLMVEVLEAENVM